MTRPSQKDMFYTANRAYHDKLIAFMEMQRSDNPLTPAEIAQMKAKWPGRYDWMPANGLRPDSEEE